MGKKLIWSVHALAQMFRRRISEQEVTSVVLKGVVIASYPKDQPYPSCLLLGYVNERPLHVVAASDTKSETVYIITAYEPDLTIWNANFRTRKKL